MPEGTFAPPLRPRRACAKCAAVRFTPFRFAAAALFLVLSAALVLSGCGGPVECKTEITDGSKSFTGATTGKTDDADVRSASLRDACRQKCAADKAPMVDACTSACVIDAGAQKLGAKTTCGKK